MTTTTASSSESPDLQVDIPDDIWDYPLYDAHCHPTDTPTTLPYLQHTKITGLALQSTRFSDQDHVSRAATDYPDKVVPAFGYHPWFSHYIYDDSSEKLQGLSGDQLKTAHYAAALQPTPPEAFCLGLPDPAPLSAVLAALREKLGKHPAALVGEIGLDRAFRVPVNWEAGQVRDDGGEDGEAPPGGRGNRRLSPYRVTPGQQKMVFVAQLRVAGEMGRAVSVHSVQAHGAVFETFRELWKGWEIRVESRRERQLRSKKGVGYYPDFAESDMSESEDEEGGRGGNGGDDEDEEEDDEEKFPAQQREGVRPYPPRVLIHSCSAAEVAVKQFLSRPAPTHIYPSQLFFSFSTTINAKHMGHLEAVIRLVPEGSILVESDLHRAGEEMEQAVAAAAVLVCKTKGWGIQEGCRIMQRNWRRYVYGDGKADNSGAVKKI